MNIKTLTAITMSLLFVTNLATAKSCKAYRSCAEVIADYPDGHFGRKDRDKDGIPCENVCRSTKQVKQLLKQQSNKLKKK